MDHRCCRTWAQSQSTLGSLANCLRSCQWFCFDWVQVEHVAGLSATEKRQKKKICINKVVRWLVDQHSERCDAQAASAGGKGELQLMRYILGKNKQPLLLTCSLFEEFGHCAGVCHVLHLLELSNQVWNISKISHSQHCCDCSACHCLFKGTFNWITMACMSKVADLTFFWDAKSTWQRDGGDWMLVHQGR